MCFCLPSGAFTIAMKICPDAGKYSLLIPGVEQEMCGAKPAQKSFPGQPVGV